MFKLPQGRMCCYSKPCMVPIRQNNRVVRAQNSSIQTKGGDVLINTQVQGKWFWAWVLNGYTTTVSGDVIKLKTAK